LPAVDELVSANPRTEEFSGGGFEFQEGFFLFVGEQIIAAVDGLVADADFRHVAEGLGAVLEDDVGAIEKVGADVAGVDGDGCGSLFLKNDFRLMSGEAKADDDDMDMGFAAGFAFPFECAVSEMDLNALCEERGP